jgi:hypothetical protein
MKTRFTSKVAMFQQALQFNIIILFFNNQQTLALQSKIPTAQI